MSDDKYKPQYIEIYHERLLLAVEGIINPDLMVDRSVTQLVRLSDDKWVIKTEFSLLKEMERASTSATSNELEV